jgi:hypothetical protein
MTAAAKRYKYLRRLIKFRQMDFEFAFWQMLYLFIAPQKVYRNFHYRKRNYCNIYLCMHFNVCVFCWVSMCLFTFVGIFMFMLAYIACMHAYVFHIFLCDWLHTCVYVCVWYMLGMENTALEPYSSFSSLMWMTFCTRLLITAF